MIAPFKLALVQMRVEPGEARLNLDRALVFVAQAAAAGAQIILLPEALPFGWTDPSGPEQAPSLAGGWIVETLRSTARTHSIFICSGIVEREETRVYNSAVLIDPAGQILLRHRKLNELDIAHSFYALGDRLAVADTPFGRIGLMICADAFARGQVITRTLGYMGARIILSPCAWAVPPDHDNTRTPYGQLWMDNYGPVARDFRLWIAGCSNVGPILRGPWAGRKCIGSSLVVDPRGQKRLQGPYDETAEEILCIDIAPEPAPALGTQWEELWRIESASKLK